MKMHCRKAKKNISLAVDGRLLPAAQEKLRAHLRGCPSCRDWNRQQLWLREQLQAPETIQPSPGFLAAIQNKIEQGARPQLFSFHPAAFRPLLLRAAMILVLVFSALLGYYLGESPDSPVLNADAEVFSQTMNLNAFSDLPADSFGAVYGRLLQGDPQ